VHVPTASRWFRPASRGDSAHWWAARLWEVLEPYHGARVAEVARALGRGRARLAHGMPADVVSSGASAT